MKCIMNETLPIGSVVKTKENDIQLMITGYDNTHEEINYDYTAVIHPTGIEYLTEEIQQNVFYFNQEEIEEVYFVGYIDKDVNERLKHAKNIRIAKNNKKKEGV